MELLELGERLRRRWARAGYPDYAWWIPVGMDSWALAAAVVAVVQRAGEHPVAPVAALMAVGATPWLAALTGWKVPWPVFTAVAVGCATTAFVRYPVDYDFALFLLVMMGGHLGATVSFWRSTIAVGVAMLVLLVLDVVGGYGSAIFWVVAVDIGWDVGFIMQYQQRRLERQQQDLAERETRVVAEEQQRIAREVHDVIAHSMSVTMLHVTAARHTLEHGGADELSEAAAALRDAESSGRAAMKDIRKAVGLMGGTTPGAPAPGIGDVARLVEDFRAAGLTVGYDLQGDPAEVPPSSALEVYRIMQESLANVAKHAPRASVHVTIDLAATPHRVTVWNSLADQGRTAPGTGGFGLQSMRRRAELLGGVLTAGRKDSGWVVEVELP